MQAEIAENRRAAVATVKEASEYTRLSVATIYNLMGQGQLAFVKIGKSRRISWTALDELLKRNTHQGAFPSGSAS
jgi:excisionase family DNA binding protein